MTPIEEFVHELRRLSSGEQSVLRRSSGKPLSDNVTAFDLFTSIYWRLERKGLDKQWLWLVMTLYSWNPLPKGEGCFGVAWRKARPTDGDGRRRHDRRLDAILSAEPSTLSVLLLQAVRTLNRRKVAVAWEEFTRDLHKWSYASSDVRQRWAKSYLQGDQNA